MHTSHSDVGSNSTAGSGSTSNSKCGSGALSDRAGTGTERRVRSDEAASSAPSFASHNSGVGIGGGGSGGTLALPKAVRRTLAGAGWVGAERGEREGLVRSASPGEAYAGGDRGGVYEIEEKRVGREVGGQGEEWGALRQVWVRERLAH
jgi:hypothetical protein